jgi:putative copper resistance protein D
MTSLPHVLYVLSAWLHILAAAAWIGGMAFLVLVLVQPLRNLEQRDLAARLLSTTGRRFRNVGWACFGILIATGFYNLSVRGITMEMMGRADFWTGPFGSVLGIKLALVVILLAMSVVHDFVIGPRATDAMAAHPRSAEALRLRRWSSLAGRITFLLSLLVVLLGVMLVRGRIW